MVHAEKETNREKKTIYIKTINKYMKKNLKRKKKSATRNVPRLTLVEINCSQKNGFIGVSDLLHQIITNKFIVSRMKPKPWWQLSLHHSYVIITVVAAAHFWFWKKEEQQSERNIKTSFSFCFLFLTTKLSKRLKPKWESLYRLIYIDG